jgi:hypothetical protein
LGFTIHGKTNAYWQGNLLIVKPLGAFNEEGMQITKQKIQQLIEQKPQPLWGRVTVFEDLDTTGPLNTFAGVLASVKYGVDNGCRLLCLVGGSHLNKDTYVTICTELNLPFHRFDNLLEAEKFAAQCDYLKSNNIDTCIKGDTTETS